MLNSSICTSRTTVSRTIMVTKLYNNIRKNGNETQIFVISQDRQEVS